MNKYNGTVSIIFIIFMLTINRTMAIPTTIQDALASLVIPTKRLESNTDTSAKKLPVTSAPYVKEETHNQVAQENLMNFYKGTRVLVTGGAGFIGSHIVEKLVKLDADVTVLDNISSGAHNNLKSVADKIYFIEGDVTNSECCGDATKDIMVVFHLAAFVSVPKSVEQPDHCNAINIEGTRNLLHACVKNGVKHFVFSSSSSVYGDRNDTCNEDDIPNPQSPYASSKLAGEQLCREYAQQHGISCAALRYFNIYGPRQDPHSPYAAVVAKFTECMLNNEPLTIFGTGKQVRDFTPVKMVVEANLLMGMQDHLNGDIFNIATGRSIDLFELTEILKEQYRIKTVDIIFKPPRPGDVISSQADHTKYQEFASRNADFSLQSKS